MRRAVRRGRDRVAACLRSSCPSAGKRLNWMPARSVHRLLPWGSPEASLLAGFGFLFWRVNSVFARLGNSPRHLLQKQWLAGAVLRSEECSDAFFPVFSGAAGKLG